MDEKIEMIEILKEVFGESGIATDPAKQERLAEFWRLVKEKNKVMNLTAVTDDREAAVLHFADSLAGAERIRPYKKILDLGSGAGFPGIPLAIVLPDSEFLLLDSLNKRIGFLNEAICALGLKNVRTIHTRAEDAARTGLRDSFDAVTARAVAPLATLAEYALPFVRPGGKFFAYKGREYRTETEAAAKAVETLNGEISEVFEFLLNNDRNRVIIEITKTGKTPAKYPRGQNKPKTHPLG